MANLITSELGFFLLLSLYAIGAAGSLIVAKRDRWANTWQNFFAIAGSMWGIAFSIGVFALHSVSFTASSSVFPFLSFSFHIDKLSAFFIFLISLITLFCSVYGV